MNQGRKGVGAHALFQILHTIHLPRNPVMTPDIENGKIAQKNLPGGALFHLGKFAIFNVQIKLQKKNKDINLL